MHIYSYTCRIHIDAMNKDERRLLKKKIPLTLFKRFVCERELETEQNCNILTPTLMAISVSFLHSRAAQLLGAGFLYRILSPTGLVSKLVSKVYLTSLSSPSYIIVQSPTQYLWNGMFDRHQVEITVMQFTGHSLPVHPSRLYHVILPCPILSAKPAYVISSNNCHRNVSLPSGASLWDGIFGWAEGRYTTRVARGVMVIVKWLSRSNPGRD